MATKKDNRTLYAPGVTREEYDWGCYYYGSREALIAAKLVESAWFPGEPNQGKTTGRGFDGSKKVTIDRRGKKSFAVRIDFSTAELNARESARLQEEAQKRISALPVSADDFRAKALDRFVTCAVVGYAKLQKAGGGYRYSEDALEDFMDELREAVSSLNNSEVIFSAAARSGEIQAIQQQAAKDDPVLQEMLCNLDGTKPTEVDHFPAPVRLASARATQCGLKVSVETAHRSSYADDALCVVWRGSEEQFRATGLFKNLPVHRNWQATKLLRGHLYRDEPDRLRFVIEWCHKPGKVPSQHVRDAAEDSSYQNFRSQVLASAQEGGAA
ncbi:MAG: hypothetical protein M0P95_07210 [Sulfuritalea sp.]|jgi:hypothetical protein|nr:hypothetical protein [Sulfuritalea sp.]